MTSGDHYLLAAERIVSLAAGVDDDHAIPATPAWSVHDLLAHLTGLAADVIDNDVDGYAQPAWTAAQVASRAGLDREAILGEWERSWTAMADILDDPVGHGLDASFASLPLIDVLGHEHDLRESLGLVDFATDDVWPAISDRRHEVLALRCALGEVGDLVVETPQGDRWVIGSPDSAPTVVADRYALYRSLEGRRPRTTVRAFDWSADPTPFLDVWLGFAFAWPEDDG